MLLNELQARMTPLEARIAEIETKERSDGIPGIFGEPIRPESNTEYE